MKKILLLSLSICLAAIAQATNCTPTSDTITTTACGSYVLNDNTYTASGTYTQTITNVAGCDSVITLNLTVNPLPTISVSIPALNTGTGNYCASNTTGVPITISPTTGTSLIVTGSGVRGTSPYFIFSPSTAGAGTYTLSYNYTDANGCSNMATTLATVNPLPTLIWASSNPTLVCSSSSLLDTIAVNVYPKGGIGTFCTAKGFTQTSDTSEIFDPTQIIAQAGNNFQTLCYQYKDLNGCITSPPNESLDVYQTPAPANIADTTASLPVNSMTFNVTNQNLLNVTWYAANQFTVLGNGNTYTPSILHTGTTTDSLKTGTYNYFYTQTNKGCESQRASAQIVVLAPYLYYMVGDPVSCPSKAAVVDQINSECYSDNLTKVLTASREIGDKGTLQWFQTSNTNNPSNKLGTPSNAYTVSITALGTYTYYVAEYTWSLACYGPTTSVSFTIYPKPNVVASVSPSQINRGDTATVSVSGADSFIWDNNLGAVSTATVSPAHNTIYSVTGTNTYGCVNTAQTSLVVTQPNCTTTTNTIDITACGSYDANNTIYNASGIYTQTLVNANGCDSILTINLTINPLPTVSASATQTNICPGALDTLIATGSGFGNISFTWQNGQGDSINVSPMVSTTYFVSANDDNSCSNTASVLVSVSSAPVTTQNPYVVCINSSVTLNTNISAQSSYTYLWSPADNLSSTTVASPAFYSSTVAGSSIYTLSVTSANGCVFSVPVSVIVNDVIPATPADVSLNALTYPIPNSLYFNVYSQNLQNVTWYNNPKTTAIGSGNTYTPIFNHTGANPDSLWAGCQYYLFTQTINGCESKPAQAQVCVINCPAQAPIAGKDPKPCWAPKLNTVLTAQLFPGRTGTLNWSNGANPIFSTFLGTGTTYTSTVTTPGSYIIAYVAEYDTTYKCYGPSTPVPLTINALPTPTISPLKTLACSGDANFPITLTPALNSNSTFTASNSAMLSGTDFVPSGLGAVSGNYALTYNYTDGNGCRNTATSSVNVNYTTTPAAIHMVNMNYPISPPSSFQFDASPQALTNVKWYDNTQTVLLGTGNWFNPPIPHTGTTPDSLVAGCYNYYSTQTINGCESKAALDEVCIVGCPAKMPTPHPVTECLANPTTALLKATAQGTGTLVWFNASNTTSTILGSGASYALTETTQGTYTVYVAEYNASNYCFGPTTPVTLTVNPLPTVAISANPSSICTGGSSTLTTTSGFNNYVWMNGVSIQNQSVSPTSTTIYRLTVTDANGCKNSASATVTVTATCTCTPTSNTITTSACGSYTLNGSTYTASGNYTQTLTNAAGCDSVITLNLIINQSTSSSITTSACGSYTLNDSVYTASGTYNQTMKNAAGCDSVITLNLTINPLPNFVFDQNPLRVCVNSSVQLNTYNVASQTYPYTFVWSPSTHLSSTTVIEPYFNSSTVGIMNYTCSITDGNGCSNNLSFSVQVNDSMPAPVVIPTTIKSDYCYTDSPIVLQEVWVSDLFIGAGSNNTDNYTIGSSSTPISEINFNNITADTSYVINYYHIADNGCSSDTVSKVVTIHYIAPPVTTGVFYVIGTGTIPPVSAALTGVSLQWYIQNKIAIPDSLGGTSPSLAYPFQMVVSPYVVIPFYVNQTDAYGCVSGYATTYDTIVPCPAKAPLVDDQVMCNYGTVPAFTFTRNNADSTHDYVFKVYDKDPIAYPLTAHLLDSNSATSFTPVLSTTTPTPGPNPYWVGEYDLTDKCMGPNTNFFLKVNSTQAPTVLPTPAICLGTANSYTLSIDVSKKTTGASVFWYDSTETTLIADSATAASIGTGNSYVVKPIVKAGTYKFYVSQGGSGSPTMCQSPKVPVSFTVFTCTGDTTVTTCNGATYNGHTASGDYTDTINNKILLVHLTVHDSIVTTVSESINTGDSVLVGSSYYKTAQTVALVLTAQSGCDSTVNYVISVQDTALNVSTATLSFANSVGSSKVYLTASQSWTAASSDQSWLTVTPAQGTGSDTIVITAAPNTTGTARTGTVTITSQAAVSIKGAYELTITVTQAADTTKTGVAAMGNNTFSIFPNPTTATFSISSTVVTKVQVYTVSGTLVLSTTVNGKEAIVTNGLPAGIYVVKIITDNEVVTRSLIVE